MTSSTQYAHARSNSPLFDQLVASRSGAHRPLSPITTSSRYAGSSSERYRAAHTAPAPVEAPTAGADRTPNLSAEEQAIVSEMGGTVARLILQMLDHDTASKRRWPFHEVK